MTEVAQYSMRDFRSGFDPKVGGNGHVHPKRGYVLAVYPVDPEYSTNTSGTVLVDIRLTNIDCSLFGVPCLMGKAGAVNGSAVTPEVGDWVLVDFVDGFFGDPIVVGYLAKPDNAVAATPIEAQAGQGPMARRVHAKTVETIDKDGNLILTVEGYHTIVTKGDVTIERLAGGGGGKITLKAETVKIEGDLQVTGNVEDATGTMSAMRGTYNSHTHMESGTETGGPSDAM